MLKSIGIVLIAAVIGFAGVGQASTLFQEDFESYSIGSLPIGPDATWCYHDIGGSAPADWPQVTQEGGEFGQVLYFRSLYHSFRQQVGAIIDIPPIRAGETLDLSFDVRLNFPSRYFRLTLRDMYYCSSGAYGCATEDPRAPVFTLESVTWMDELSIGVSPVADPVNPNAMDEQVCSQSLSLGTWYHFQLLQAPGLLQLFVNGDKVGELTNSAYDLGEKHDWMLLLGDGSSNSPWLSDLFVDNILLQIVTAQAQPEPTPYLNLVSIRLDGSIVMGTLINTGDVACCGEIAVSVGLSYCTSWVPEWCTIFQEVEYGEICLGPGESIDLEFELESVPEECRTAFAEQLVTMWTGYVDPDPDDYLGIVFSIGSEHCCGFLPDEE